MRATVHLCTCQCGARQILAASQDYCPMGAFSHCVESFVDINSSRIFASLASLNGGRLHKGEWAPTNPRVPTIPQGLGNSFRNSGSGGFVGNPSPPPIHLPQRESLFSGTITKQDHVFLGPSFGPNAYACYELWPISKGAHLGI